jgi:uncharacterized membrane protein
VASIVETLDLEVPVETAYALWADVTRWPEFLHHVEKVKRVDEETFHWWLDIPGADEDFTAKLTEVVPDKRIAWTTVGGIAHSGVVDFHYIDEGRSQITFQVDYEPEGFVEKLGSLLNMDSVLANYDLGQFKAAVESVTA